MALACMMYVLPCSHAFVIQSRLFNHLQILDFAPHQRLQRSLQLKESKLRNMMEITRIVGKHSTDFEAKGGEEKLLVDNGPKEKPVAGGVVALGKFDALHVGHRALAVQASKMGPPVLLSFTGMAEVLQWEKRLPIVAPCDRKRIMSLWEVVCGGNAPQEYHLEFAKVRSLSPHDFVEKLAKELHVKGVVAGADYRFGYKAAGDASDLVQLCGKFGLEVSIVDPVMDEAEKLDQVLEEFKGASSREKGQVSSTRVRKALSVGDMRRVAELLGREHRLVLTIDACTIEAKTIHAPISNALNQVPRNGMYSSRICWSLDGSGEVSVECGRDGRVKIEDEQVVVSLSEGSFQTDLNGQIFLFVDMQNRLPNYVT